MFIFLKATSMVKTLSADAHRHQFWGWGRDHPRFWGGELWGLHEILLYSIM